MNIPPKYEDVVAQLDEALSREAALREELDTVRDLHAKQCCVFCNDTGNLRSVHADLQQRLTVAEQREVDLKRLLCDVINEAPTGFAALKVDLANRANDALKPAAEGEGS